MTIDSHKLSQPKNLAHSATVSICKFIYFVFLLVLVVAILEELLVIRLDVQKNLLDRFQLFLRHLASTITVTVADSYS